MEDDPVLGRDELRRGTVEVLEIDVGRAAVAVEQLGARHAKWRLELDDGPNATLLGSDALEPELDWPDPAYGHALQAPSVWAGEVDKSASGHPRGQAVARLVVDQLPAALAYRGVLAK
jgi:hypothetical protein